MICSICIEDFPAGSSALQKLSCCEKSLCRNCLYSHVKSILEEGVTGDGRKELKCPFGCGAEIPDHIVRLSISQRHWTFVRKVIGPFLHCLFRIIGYFTRTSKFHDYNGEAYAWLTRNSSERRDLQLYERWSLTVALSSIMYDGDDSESEGNEQSTFESTTTSSGGGGGDGVGDANQVYTHVIHCPRPDCECLWLTNRVYRRRKLANERAYNKKKRPEERPKGLTKSLLLSASGWLFFKPLKPEVEEEIMDENGYTTLHWLNAKDIDVFRKANNNNGNGNGNAGIGVRSNLITQHDADKDGRRVTCPGCEFQFCALCLRPWSTLSRYSGARICHTGKLCSIYGKKIISKKDDDYIDMADAGDARCCPGCSIRTNRTDGCNHMTCPCGYEWCYVCGCRWNSRHYSCTDENRQIDGDSSCVIC